MRRLIVGDIHGCWRELQELLDLAGPGEDDEIIAVGDVVDRGPDSASVLDFFRRRQGARSILGNHERKHVRGARGEAELAVSQRLVRDELGESYEEAVAFMAAFPLVLDLPEATLIHGFWEPGVALEDQQERFVVGTIKGELELWRRLGRPWWELYDREKPLVVGHHDYVRDGSPMIFEDRVFGIDTGCCYGGALTGLILPEFRVVSVRSHANYWGQACAALREGRRRQEEAESRPAARLDDATVRQILARCRLEAERLLAELRRDPAFIAAPPHLQGEMLRERVGRGPVATLLHLARRDELDVESLRRVIGTAAAFAEVAGRFAIVAGEDDE